MVVGVVALLAVLVLVVRAAASRLLAQLAFGAGAKESSYTAAEATLWLRTRRARLPALHLARGAPVETLSLTAAATPLLTAAFALATTAPAADAADAADA
ncbi:MAG: hypothetical protein VX017_10690 [Pseudomonadota bacterium]|nr:hypothetical protein [Pseudomonadota bacterium]